MTLRRGIITDTTMRSRYTGVLCLLVICVYAQAGHAASIAASTHSLTRMSAARSGDKGFSGNDCAGPAVVRLPAPLGGMGMSEFLGSNTAVECRFSVSHSNIADAQVPTSTDPLSQINTPLAAAEGAGLQNQPVSAANGLMAASSVRQAPSEILAMVPQTDAADRAHADHFSNVGTARDPTAPDIPWSKLIGIGFAILVGIVLLALAIAGSMIARARWFSPRETLARAAKRGLRRNEFHLEYQPVFYTRTQKCVGLEVMLRWKNSAHGIRGAEWYMEQLDGSPVADKILSYVFAAAAKEIEALGESTSLYVLVDVPASSLKSDSSIASLIRMANTLASSCRLVLQVPVDDVADVLPAVAQLRAEKIRVGLSRVRSVSTNFESLAHSGFEFLKVDREVMGFEEGARAHQLQEIAAVGRRLNMAVIVDGVEGVSQFHAVGRAHIDLAQGFYLGKAISASRFPTFFDQMRNGKEDQPHRLLHAFQSH
jgi:EAL domain-containing protein (putative c-di-GMP-specific phosphodiesterase class I)